MLSTIFHAWERRLADVTKDRVVRPFAWGEDWLPLNGHPPATHPRDAIGTWVSEAMRDSDRFYQVDSAGDYRFDGHRLSYSSELVTPHPENNVVRARYFPAAGGTRRRAVVILPQWNADREGHIGLSKVLARFGISALRLSLPYHDERMPPELHRADYIVSANVGRTIQVCRQAVLDTRRAVAWLASQGYQRIGLLGTSLGSCLAMLTAAHEPLVRAAALNHVSPFFADVVWEGLSTRHVREGLDGHVDLETLRTLWMPISPFPFLERMHGRRVLLVYARYDLTFPVRLSRLLIEEFRRRAIPHDVAALPAGHYSTGIAPFSWLDCFVLTRFLRRAL